MGRKLLKAVVAAGAAIFGLVIILYTLALVINWNDRPPSETAQRFDASHRDRAQVDDADNAYIYMQGFSVGIDEDPRLWGEKRIAWAERLRSLPWGAPIAEYPGEDYDFASTRSPTVEALSSACQGADAACRDALGDEQSVTEWLESEEWLLERYRTLIDHPGWLESVPFNARAQLPRYGDIREGQRLLFARAWQLAGRKDTAAIKILLERDVRFWRRVLADADILITKLIATSALRHHFTWSNLVLRRLPPDRVTDAIPESWMTPITDVERSMRRCLTGEWKFAVDMLEEAKEGGANPLATDNDEQVLPRLLWSMAKPMFQTKDSANRYAKHLTSLSETLEVPYDRLPRALERARELEKKAADGLFPRRIYNWVGDVMFALHQHDFSAYGAKVADLEGIRRTALLSARFRKQGLPPEQVAARLEANGNLGPYGDPFQWDETERAIVFIGLSGDGDRYVMPLM